MSIKPFSDFATPENLYPAYRKTRVSKRKKRQEARFECHQFDGLDDLANELRDRSFKPLPLNKFLIYEPKEREINAPSFRDKIVQRALTDQVLYQALEPSIPFLSWAAQTGKGQHSAVEMLAVQMRHYFLRRKAEDEEARRAAGLSPRPIEEWDYFRGYIVKGDIRKCFKSTNHEKLKAKVNSKLPEEPYMWLYGLYVDQMPEDEGVALGHQTSHISVVYFVSQPLREVTAELGLHEWGMYMDDWYIICETKEEAKAALAMAHEKFGELGYELNEKTQITSLRQGLDFCGFRVYLTRSGKTIKKLRNSTKKRLKRRIKKWDKDYQEGLITKEEIEQKFQASVAHMKHGNTKELVRQLRRKVNNIYEKENTQT